MKVARITPALLLFLSFCLLSAAQTEEEIIQQEINTQIWKPFCEAYGAFDAEKFNAVHTDDVVRATPWGLRIGEEYKQQNRKNMTKSKAEGNKRTIELWFEHRVTDSNMSYEVGYYKVTSNSPDEDTQTYYGRFHCVIKKLNGVWKIAQDWDDDDINGHKVNAEDWAKGQPMNF